MIVATPGKYFTRPYAWPFPKFSPFLDIFNFYISELIEKGQWNAIVNKYQGNPQVCPDLSGKPIDFSNCFTAFLILISGAILSILFFAGEFIIKPFEGSTWMMSDLEKEKKMQTPIEDMDREHMKYTIEKQRVTIERLYEKLRAFQDELT